MDDLGEHIKKLEKENKELQELFGIDNSICRLEELKDSIGKKFDFRISKQIGVLDNRINQYSYLVRFVEDALSYANLVKDEGDSSDKSDAIREINGLVVDIQNFKFEQYFQEEYDANSAIFSLRLNIEDPTPLIKFISNLIESYKGFSENKGLDVKEMSTESGDHIVFKITGKNAYGYFKGEQGNHRVVYFNDKSTKANKCKKHTSYMSVSVCPEIEPEEYDINKKDLKIEHLNGTGAGGQHVNKNKTGIRITHNPTRIAVTYRTRSLEQSQKLAYNELMFRINKYNEQKNEKGSKNISSEEKHCRTYDLTKNTIKDHNQKTSITIKSGKPFDIEPFVIGYRASLK